MQTEVTAQHNNHTHLVQKLSTMMVQINALQALVRDENMAPAGNVGATLAASCLGDRYAQQDATTSLETLRDGLGVLEQMTREILHEIRSIDENAPLVELIGVTLPEALSRAVEETAETLGLPSRIVFSGQEHPLPSYSEGLLYRIAQEALYQVQQHTGTRKLRFVFTYGHDDVQMSIEDDGTVAAVGARFIAPASEAPFKSFVPTESLGARFIAPIDDTPAPPFTSNFPATTDAVLSDLRHRIEHLDGSLEMSTNTDEGNRVRVRLPYGHHEHSEITETQNTGERRDASDRTQGRGDAVGTKLIAPAGVGRDTPPNEGTFSTQPGSLTEPIRVLVVERQAVTRAGLRRLLETYSDLQVVGEAADGVQAVSETLELGPQVVLIDMQLPNGQSLEALRQIKQLNLNTQVLLLSALDREEYLYETLRAGAGGYVLKDIAPDELAQAVRTVARGEVLVQPQLARRLLSQFGQQTRGNHPFETLTTREQEVLRLLARGLRNKEMAARLHVSERTINFHLANIYQKLNVSGRTEALSKALEQGLITA